MEDSKVVRLESLYDPRRWQARAHLQVKRHNVLIMHRRSGKTVFVINELRDRSFRFMQVDPLTGKRLKNPQYAYVATTIGQAEKVAWPYFKEFYSDIPGVHFDNRKLRVTYPSEAGLVTIHVLGAENFEVHRGLYLDGYILDEFADMHPDVRDKIFRPTISDRKRCEIIIGTPKGDNRLREIFHIAVLSDKWHTLLLKASESGLIDDEELEELRETMSAEAYLQEYECDFNAVPSGRYYEAYIQEMEKEERIREIPHDRSKMVATFWDLGIGDSTAIWFVQEDGDRPLLIDYLEYHGKGLDYYVNELNLKGYTYSQHVLPHDGRQRDIGTGKTRIQTLEDLGLKNIQIMEKMPIDDGIQKTRLFLTRCHMDRENTSWGRKAVKSYERKYDSKLQRYANTPLHNWASHGSDALRVLAQAYEPGCTRKTNSDRINEGGLDQADCDWDELG